MMISTKEIKEGYAEVCKALASKRVKDALSQMRELALKTQNGDVIDAHYDLELTYKNILKYTVEGINDPERQKVYNHLVRDVYALSDRVLQQLFVKYSSEPQYEIAREFTSSTFQKVFGAYQEVMDAFALKMQVDNTAVSSPELNVAVKEVFNWFWVMPMVYNTEGEEVKRLLNGNDVLIQHKSLLVSAITLSLLRTFSADKLQLLIDLVQHDEDLISGRAIAGLLLSLYKYDDRLYLYPELYTRLFMMAEEPGMNTLIQSVTIQLIRTRETEKISRKLHDEIIPEVSKINPKIKDKLDLENLLGDNMQEDENPEWEKLFGDSPGLISKMEELTQWQMEGADVFLATFKMLKHFPFFNKIENWLMPFYPENSAVVSALEEESDLFKNSDLLSGLADSRFLCNSDKYSLILSIPHMPAMQKNLMGQMFSAELDQMAELQKDEAALQAHQGKLVVSNQFIQDLYRLMKLYPQKHQFEDLFSQRMDFHNKWFFRQSLVELDTLREIGEFYFKKYYFDDALEIFELIHQKQPDAQDVIQKIAYCYQQINNYKQALSFYLKAELIDGNSNWLKKKIALCYRHLKQPSKALSYYQEAESILPDNLHTIVSIGSCYLELKEFEEALKYYFKVEYLDPGNAKAGRPIAWCSFILGRFDQAEKSYNKLLVSGETKHDLMNLGHVLWCKKMRKEALAYYQKSIQREDFSFEEFLETFMEDLEVLEKHGIDKVDVPIMLDQIRYWLED